MEWSRATKVAIWTEVAGSRRQAWVKVVEGRYSSNRPLSKVPSSLAPILSGVSRASQTSSLPRSRS